MGRKCSVCHHPELEEIERDLAEGDTYTRVARRYCCTREQVRYYAEHCMSEKLKDQRFRVLKKRLERRIEKNLLSGVKKLSREMAKDLLETLGGSEKPHNPHIKKCNASTKNLSHERE